MVLNTVKSSMATRRLNQLICTVTFPLYHHSRGHLPWLVDPDDDLELLMQQVQMKRTSRPYTVCGNPVLSTHQDRHQIVKPEAHINSNNCTRGGLMLNEHLKMSKRAFNPSCHSYCYCSLKSQVHQNVKWTCSNYLNYFLFQFYILCTFSTISQNL